MMTSATSSTPRLSEVARHLVIPAGISGSVWPKLRRRLASAGVYFDPWQQGFSAAALGYRADGKYAATVGGVVASIPRQVGKTFTVGHLLIALAAEFPGTRMVWTSHHGRTTTNTFRAMQAMVRRSTIAPLIAPNGVRVANGEQEIRYRNDSLIMFGAREHGFGRGLDAIDVEVFDEAQILSLKALEDMVPATNQARHPHGALLFFIGTPPRPGDDGEAFSTKRDDAIACRTTDQMYVELAADPGAAWDDREQWKRMNPSYPTRTPEEAMLRMRANIPDPSAWRREAMGVWDELEALSETIVDPERWAALVTPDPPMHGDIAYGIKFSPDGQTVAVAVALRPADGPIHVEGIGHRLVSDGTKWMVDWLGPRWSESKGIVVDGRAGAGGLVKALRRSGVPERRVVTPTTEQAITAHAMFLTAITEASVSHIGDAVLDDSVLNVARRPIGNNGGFGFRPATDVGDVTLAEAAALAHFGAANASKSTGRQSGRTAVVL